MVLGTLGLVATIGTSVVACENPEAEAKKFEKSIQELIDRTFNQKVSWKSEEEAITVASLLPFLSIHNAISLFPEVKPKEGVENILTITIKPLDGKNLPKGATTNYDVTWTQKTKEAQEFEAKFIPYSEDFRQNKFKDQEEAILAAEEINLNDWDERVSPRPVKITPGSWMTEMGNISGMPSLIPILTMKIEHAHAKTLPETAEIDYFLFYQLIE